MSHYSHKEPCISPPNGTELLFQVVINSTEWELILDLHDFDEPWMRFARGRETLLINITEMEKTPLVAPFQFIEKTFDGDWRSGKEIRQIKITQRDYQISAWKNKARFFKYFIIMIGKIHEILNWGRLNDFGISRAIDSYRTGTT